MCDVTGGPADKSGTLKISDELKGVDGNRVGGLSEVTSAIIRATSERIKFSVQAREALLPDKALPAPPFSCRRERLPSLMRHCPPLLSPARERGSPPR